VYSSALVDADELFDYQLRQVALALRDQGDVPELTEPEESYEIVVQIWNAGGTLVYLSHPSSDLPQRATLGFDNVRTQSGDWRVFSIQVRGRTIQVAQPESVRRELARTHALRTLLPVLVLLPLLGAALWFGAERALRPVSVVTRQVRARDPKLLTPLLEEQLPEELSPLVRALNDLLRRLSVALDAQRAFVADAAHELRSPLTALRLQIQLLDRTPDPQQHGAAKAQLAAGIERASHLVDQLLTLARSDPDASERPLVPTRLDEAAREAVAEMAPFADARGVDLGLAGAEEVTLRGDPDALRVLIRNLADNAVRYTPRGGRVDVRVQRREGEAVLEVADTGPGIPAADRERVFARFYRRLGGDERGSGLGLAIVKAAAERHSARIELDDAPGGGLLARVVFRTQSL
jgi:signal transduction histidine kinase